MAMSKTRQVSATKRKRIVHARRKKVVERRHVYYIQCLAEQAAASAAN